MDDRPFLSGPAAPPPRRPRWRRRLAAGGLTAAVHAVLLFVLIGAEPRPARLFEPRAVSISLAPPLAPPSPPPARAEARSPAAPRARPRPLPPAPAAPAPRARPPAPVSIPVAATAPQGPPSVLGEGALAGALTAGGGDGPGGSGAGRGCDMIRRIQQALRRDARIQAEVADARRLAGGPRDALLLWNGDWIRSAGQDGKGLAGVRQAIMLEVAFAPEACRAEPMHGLVLISLDDGPGGGRLALGERDWRWSDLLFARR